MGLCKTIFTLSFFITFLRQVCLNTLYWKNWMIWLVQNWIADISTQWLSVLEIHLLLCWFDWWKVTKQQFIIPTYLFPHCNWTKQNLFLSKDWDKCYLISFGCPCPQVLVRKLKDRKLMYLLVNFWLGTWFPRPNHK